MNRGLLVWVFLESWWTISGIFESRRKPQTLEEMMAGDFPSPPPCLGADDGKNFCGRSQHRNEVSLAYLEVRKGFLENGNVLALATAGRPHHHETVPHADHLVKLDGFGEKDGHLQEGHAPRMLFSNGSKRREYLYSIDDRW